MRNPKLFLNMEETFGIYFGARGWCFSFLGITYLIQKGNCFGRPEMLLQEQCG